MGLITTPAHHHHVAVPHPAQRWRSAGSTERTLAASIVGFVAFLAAGMIALAIDGVTGSPASDAPDGEITEFFADHRFAHLVNMHLSSVAILVLLPLFAVSLASVLRSGDGRRDHLAASVVLAAGLVATLAGFVQAVAWSAAAYGAADHSPDVLRGLHDLGNVGFVLMAYPMGVLMVAASVGGRRAALLDAGPARVGIVLGALVALSALAFTTVMIGFVLFVVWSIALSWHLLGRSPGPGTASAPPGR